MISEKPEKIILFYMIIFSVYLSKAPLTIKYLVTSEIPI